MLKVFIDIETIPQQGEGVFESYLEKQKNPYKRKDKVEEWENITKFTKAEEGYRKTALDGAKGEIVCVCWAVENEDPIGAVRNLEEESEKDFIKRFDAMLFDSVVKVGARQYDAMWVGHNVVGFDLPFIAKRTLKHQLRTKMKYPLSARPMGNRNIYDTMKEFAGWTGSVSLNTLANMFGLGDKIASGGDVWDMAQAKDYNRILEYCLKDVEITREVYRYLHYEYAEETESGEEGQSGPPF